MKEQLGSVLQIGVGSKFQERLAELVWANCPELARQTAAGQMALSLDSTSTKIQDQMIAALVPEVVKALKGDVAKQVKERMKDKVLQEVAKNVVIDITSAMQRQFTHLVHGEVTKVVKTQVEAALQHEFGNRNSNGSFGDKNVVFAAYVRKRLDALVDEELGHRVRLSAPVEDAITEATDKCNKQEAGRG
jgi:glycine cleavage system H lipoate-binding protein